MKRFVIKVFSMVFGNSVLLLIKRSLKDEIRYR